jgi:pilus assembly protein CpaB
MNRRIGLIAVAVVLALVGTFAVYSYAHNADKRAVENTRSVSVLYAKKQVPVGTTWGDAIKGDYFTKERVPVKAAPSTAISDTDASIPLREVATADIAAGQIAVRAMFGEKVATTGILAIPKGLQAVSVTLPSNADVAGFVQNGSEVAIYVTFKIGKTGKAQGQTGKVGGSSVETDGIDIFVTKLLLARVPVIAVSQDAPSDLNGGKDAASNNNSTSNVLVTLALSQAEAERLILGQQTGQLYIGLLNASSVTAPDGGIVNVGVFKPTPIFLR